MLVLAAMEEPRGDKASVATHGLRRHTVLFRFWLFTSLIVAFVAYCGAFGIRLVPSAAYPAFSDGTAGPALMDDDPGRGR